VNVPSGAELFPIPAGNCNFNDVAATSVARFEINQLRRAWQLMRRDRFQIVHRVTPSGIGISSLLPALRIPLVVGPLLASTPPPATFDQILHRAYAPPPVGRLHPRRVGASLAWRANDWLAKRDYLLRAAHRIIVGTRLAWERVPPALRGRCELLPYSGVEHDIFVPPATRSSSRPLQLLYVGRLVPYKGLELLLRAVGLAARHCDLEIRIVGGGEVGFGAYCRRLGDELGLSSRIQFVPSVNRQELLRFYQQADVFCFPTLCDTYGIALLEAMSCACPVIVSDTSGAREIVNELFGIKIPLHEPELYVNQFADAIVKLAREPDLREVMGRHARQQVKMNHDWTTIGNRLLEIYEGL
jgi:glycosyltransferase involved in cell wall biosynthesis